ncbi:MAG: serine/threonine protein kinase [Myxococcales bacterium]|nr:serine/threonine protein kinase [Myxococcales bacterium]
MKLCPKCQKHFSDDANFCPVDAARLVPLETKPVAEDSLSARFTLGESLGGGRTGVVHKAIDKTTGKPCVVKLVAGAVVALPGVAQRLERELKQLERVQSAGVAKVLASGKRGDETWLAMEWVEGAQTLSEAITARGPIPTEQATDLIEVVGEALIEAAQVGVVHRDLGPKNVLFAGQDVKLINFSLPVPTSDKVPGVPEFVAPEQVDGRPVDQRSNLYSLGALYYYVLTGQPVFSGSADEVHKQHTGGSVKPPSQLAQVPAPVEAVIMRALDRSPTKRFLTVRQFVDEVGRVGRGEVIELKQTAPLGRAGSRPRGDLVQTLMGVKGGMSPLASAPTVGSGTPAVSPSVLAAAPAAPAASSARPPTGGNPMAQTAIGVPRGDLPQSLPAHVSPVSGIAPLTPPPGMGSGAPALGAGSGAPSPWSPPAGAAAPAVAAPVVAAPVVAAPQVAAPQLAAPQVAAQPAGKKKAPEEPATKGKFRETMWFKKGELDVQAAEAAAAERARTGKEAGGDKADSLPIDERYEDDGSITRSDKEKYSLRTGATQMMAAIPDQPEDSGRRSKTKRVSEDALIGEMKGGRTKVMVAIILVIAIAVVIIIATR